MYFSIRRKITLLITILAVIFFAGLKTTMIRTTVLPYSSGRMTVTQPVLTLYGAPICTSKNAGRFYGLIQLGHDKYLLILATLLVGLGLFGLAGERKDNVT